MEPKKKGLIAAAVGVLLIFPGYLMAFRLLFGSFEPTNGAGDFYWGRLDMLSDVLAVLGWIVLLAAAILVLYGASKLMASRSGSHA